MLLQNKIAVIYGAGGSIGSAVAKAFADNGARLFLSGHHPDPVQNVANMIRTSGGVAEVDTVDALDEEAVNKHLDKIIHKTGKIDISFNVIGVDVVQNIPLTDIKTNEFMKPITMTMQSRFCSDLAGRITGVTVDVTCGTNSGLNYRAATAS